jgi:hypothetical protein
MRAADVGATHISSLRPQLLRIGVGKSNRHEYGREDGYC